MLECAKRGSKRRPEPIAIIGAAARLPGAPDLTAFAELLRQGVDAVTEVPEDRFEKARWYHPRQGEAGRSYSFAAGTIGEIADFGLVAYLYRSDRSFRLLGVRKPGGFCLPTLSACGVDYRSR
jgi:phthiocerol/phenolphthiocerol synthesis type-I polyketide synthase C